MHRRHSAVTLGLLSALCASLANAQSNAAQPSSTNEDGSTQLETVVVESGPFGGRGDDELTRPVDVIYGDALARKNKATIGDLLSEEPGVANSGFGPGVGHPVIRGQSGPRVSILQNGIGSMDASSVSADHAVALDPGGAEQVEIIMGPATLIYGQHDPVITSAYYEGLESCFAQIERIDLDAMHFVQEEQPEAFAEALLRRLG